MNFTIDPDVKQLLDPLTPDEYDRLDQSIWRDRRVRDKLIIGVIGTERILADGHNRLEIAVKRKLDYETEDMYFANRIELYQWVIDNQLGRRNLTDERRAYYIGKEYAYSKQAAPFEATVGNSYPPGKRVSEVVAEKHNVSEKTVRTDAAYAEAVDKLPEPIKEQVLSGESGIPKQQIIDGVVPKLCKSCKKRETPVHGCTACKALRTGQKQEAEKPKKKSATKKKPKEPPKKIPCGVCACCVAHRPKATKDERDLLFDAIAEVCAADKKSSASHIGKLVNLLLSAEPPYTSEEVRRWGAMPRDWLKGDPPSLGLMEKTIGTVRAKGAKVKLRGDFNEEA